MQLKEEQERYIERAQQEKEELQQEMAQQSRSLQQAQQQLEEVRQNRQRADEDVEVRPGVGWGEAGRVSSLGHRLWGQAAFPETLALAAASCATLDKFPNFLELVSRLGKETGNSVVMKIK